MDLDQRRWIRCTLCCGPVRPQQSVSDDAGGAFEPVRPRRRSPPMGELFDDALLPALAASIVAFLLLLYVWGIVGAYRAAGDGWKAMDRDVRLVFLLAVPLFRGGIQVLLWVDKLFYTPKAEKMTARGSDAQRNTPGSAAL